MGEAATQFRGPNSCLLFCASRSHTYRCLVPSAVTSQPRGKSCGHCDDRRHSGHAKVIGRVQTLLLRRPAVVGAAIGGRAIAIEAESESESDSSLGGP